MTHHVKEQALMGGLDGGLQVSITEDDVGTLATQLQSDSLDVVCGGPLNDFTDFG